jgi:hypothetical protein
MVAALTILAGIALLVSGACLAIFFATGSDPWGRANDATVAAWALLMIPSALELSSRYAGRSWAVVLVTALGGRPRDRLDVGSERDEVASPQHDRRVDRGLPLPPHVVHLAGDLAPGRWVRARDQAESQR